MSVFKNAPLEFTVNPYNQGVKLTNIKFSTMDKGTAKLEFQLFKDGVPLPLSALKGKLTMVFPNGSKRMKEVTLLDKIEGKAEYILDEIEIKQYGTAKAALVMFYSNGQTMSVHEFTFNIEQSLVDQDIAPLAEYYIDDFETLKYAIEKMSSEAKQTLEELKAKFEDLEKIETKEGAQAKVDEHAKDTKLHVTEAKQKSWDAKETTTGSQSKADAALSAAKKYTDEHANNKEIHVIQSDKDKWNNGQLYRLTQNNGKPIYKGTSETTDYNEITDTGFYLIFNKGVNGPPSTNASFMIVISYTSTLLQTTYSTDGKKSYYRIRKTDSTWTEWTRVLTEEDKTPQSEIDKWNNGQLYKMTQDSGTRKLIPEGSDLLTLSPGFYFGINNRLLNNPDPSDTGWFNYDVSESGSGRKMVVAVASYKNTMWYGTVHTNGDFKGWKRILTAEDVANSTFVDTYDQDNSSINAAENVATKLVFGATRADDLSEYNRTRSEITLKNNGLYLIRLYVTSTNITVGSDNILSCYVNGTEFQRFGNWNPTTASSTCVLYLTQKFKAGDKVTFYITPKGTNKTISINTAYVTMSQLR
ncbi:BppU family phage baseplate upper protein [Bacillus safensis]|uniref:BppU family phage baseplate upper protein n=1 Tax=Bacillus safensis TaxID=561879 RepID=UPI00203F4B63|nr:BppU family phage baseplate upper protein [Bacillus safensis]MCM3367857.1 BppU family phage baseplate upper protein [Bacillus safensis]